MTGERIASRGAVRLRVPLLALLLCVVAAPARAHPGVGIVRDRQGNVYYTDLSHVWRIAPDGRKAIVVRDVHTHELALDSAGVLFGEDSEYLGGDRYRHRVWRRLPNGRVDDVIPWRDGFWREYGFVRDAAGTSYWVNCPERVCTIRRRTADGRVQSLTARPPFVDQIQRLAAAPAGALYVLDGDALKRISSTGEVRTVSERLGGAPMGMWSADSGDVYVAVYHRRAVLRVTPAGRQTVVARTPVSWGPSGVLRAANGDLWILEYSTTNAARVRRVSPSGRVRVF